MEMTTKNIRFYYNGIKVNGEKLTNCIYSKDGDKITVSANHYGCGHLPRDVFAVVNDSNYYTDDFKDDYTVLTPNHPLYRFAEYAWYKAQVHDIERYIKYATKRNDTAEIERAENQLQNLPTVKNPGHPTDADLAKVEAMRNAEESARIKAEKEEQQRQRERVIRTRNEGRQYIETVMAEHPLSDGEPVVTIGFSENPAFYSWGDGELHLSVAAADIIFRHYDEAVAAEGRGYDKTDFRVDFTRNGEPDFYSGRYDLGDMDGGLIEHIRKFSECAWVKTEQERQEIVEIADFLNNFIPQGWEVSFSPELIEAIKRRASGNGKILDFPGV